MAQYYVTDGYVASGYFQTGISVDWNTKTIYIPQFFLTYVSGNLYVLDTDAFRLALKDIEDSDVGMVFPDTHRHNTVVSLGGISYARTLEIINGYTITFEETGTPYVVSLTGSNNNIVDVTNLGTVQILSNNSAGLIYTGGGSAPTAQQNADAVWANVSRTLTQTIPTTAQIADAVWDEPHADHDTETSMGHLVNIIDQIPKAVFLDLESPTNGNGSQHSPFNNVNDAIDYCEGHGVTQLRIIGDTILPKNLKNLEVIGVGVPEIDANGKDLKNSEFRRIKFKGDYLQSVTVQESVLLNGAFLNGFFENCAIAGNLTVKDGANVYAKNCASSLPNGSVPNITMGNSSTLNLSEYYGKLSISGCSDVATSVIINLANGSVVLDSSNTSGTILVTGIGVVTDNSNGSTVVNQAIDGSASGGLTVDQDQKLTQTWQSQFNRRLHNKNNNTITLYDDDKITPLQVFDTNSDVSEINPQ